MTHQFSFRVGFVVIMLLVAIFAVLYPLLSQSDQLPVRQTTEIRPASAGSDEAARRAIERDLTP